MLHLYTELAWLPRRELDACRLTVENADLLAQSDGVTAGFRSLREGLRRAERKTEAGEPWGPGLAHLYGFALDEFSRVYGGRLLE